MQMQKSLPSMFTSVIHLRPFISNNLAHSGLIPVKSFMVPIIQDPAHSVFQLSNITLLLYDQQIPSTHCED